MNAQPFVPGPTQPGQAAKTNKVEQNTKTTSFKNVNAQPFMPGKKPSAGGEAKLSEQGASKTKVSQGK